MDGPRKLASGITSEVEPKFRRQCTRGYIVRAAESGEEVIEGVFVRDIDGR